MQILLCLPSGYRVSIVRNTNIDSQVGVVLIISVGVVRCPLFGGNFVLKQASVDSSCCPLSGAEKWPLLGGWFYIRCMLKSIGAWVSVRSREVGRFSEGPL